MQKSKYFRFDELEKITKNFAEKVGEGRFGEVYKGVDGGKEIAVKKLRHLQGLDDKAFDNEFLNLSGIQHPNVVQVIGYCHEQRRKFLQHGQQLVTAYEMERVLCFEYVQGGSLQEHIFGDRCDLDWLTCYGIIKGTCEGLNHLHTVQGRPIYHRDLKPANILLDNNMMPKIDLGLSRLVASTGTYNTQARDGTLGYMPPEYLDRGDLSPKFDVFSLGVIIVRIMDGVAGNSRRFDMPRQQFIEHVTKNWKERLPVTSKSSQEINMLQVKTCVDIALRCVEADRNKRPRIQEIINEIKALEDKIKKMSLSSNHPKDLNGQGGSPKCMTRESLKKITKNFSHPIGSGTFGKVYMGVQDNGEKIAVKELPITQLSGDYVTGFEEELKIVMGLKHRNIVKLLGYCYEDKGELVEHEGKDILAHNIFIALCFEYMENGSLDKHLHDETGGMDWQTRYKIIKGTCHGLEYLHDGLDNPIYHLDLKPGNILLSKTNVPKIADFDTSKLVLDNRTQATTSFKATRRYSPPEYRNGGESFLFSNKYDIFSFGVVMMEIIAGIEGYNNINDKKYIDQVQKNWGKRTQPLEYECMKRCIEIALRCVDADRAKRPKIRDIISMLNETENNAKKLATTST